MKLGTTRWQWLWTHSPEFKLTAMAHGHNPTYLTWQGRVRNRSQLGLPGSVKPLRRQSEQLGYATERCQQHERTRQTVFTSDVKMDTQKNKDVTKLRRVSRFRTVFSTSSFLACSAGGVRQNSSGNNTYSVKLSALKLSTQY